jgi:hypothetical protein
LSRPDLWITLTATGDLRLLDWSDATPRWEVGGVATRPPLAVYPALIATRENALIRLNAEDGQESEWYRWPDDRLAPATPLLSMGGRVYYQTARGWPVCLAEAP